MAPWARPRSRRHDRAVTPSPAEDIAHMRSALALARRGIGNTWPNPSVGCVIVQDGRVVGRAVTAPGGRPHAEPAALDMAGEAARGRHRLRHAGALLPLGPHAALHRCADRRRRRPCGDRHARSRPAGGWRGHRAAARGRRSRSTRACFRSEADELAAGFRSRVRAGPAAGDAEARLHAGWPDRHAVGREPVDHRRGGASRGARAARTARRGDGRRRHRAGRRSGADLPPARLPAQPGGARRRRQPSAHAAHVDACRHGSDRRRPGC